MRSLAATEAAVVPVTVSSHGAAVGSVTTSWGGRTYRVPVVTAHGSVALRLAGSAGGLRCRAPTGGTRAAQKGSTVGSALFALGTQIQVVPARSSPTTVPEPSLWWRLVHRV